MWSYCGVVGTSSRADTDVTSTVVGVIMLLNHAIGTCGSCDRYWYL